MSLRTYASLLKFVADQHGVFTTAEAAQHRVTERQLAGLCDEGVVNRLFRGVYRFTSTPNFDEAVARRGNQGWWRNVIRGRTISGVAP